MDQKTILAIILSIAVLFGYEVIFVAPKRAGMLKNAQVTVNKEVVGNTAVTSIEPPNIPEISTNVKFISKDWDLKSPQFSTKLTNVGGTLHNLLIDGFHPLPLSQILAIKGTEFAQFQPAMRDDQKAAFTYADDSWHITKIYKVRDDHSIDVRIEVSSVKEISRLDNIEFILIGIDSSKLEGTQRETMLDEYSVLAGKKILRKGNAVKFDPNKEGHPYGTVSHLQWAGFRDHYSAIVIQPKFQTKDYEIKALTEHNLTISIKPESQKLPAGGVAVYEFTIYAGPQDQVLMKQYGGGIERIVAFSNWWPLDMIAKAIYYTIPFLYGICKSWGVSIILISVLIYGLTYPLTIKSMMSMRKMQQMQPKVKALQEKYKNDPQKLNAEIMDFYRREKINPLGGCLPFLLQMPIFISLYQVLWRSSYFQGKGFFWIKDLTLPDRLFIMPFSLPFLGNEFNILPLLMAGVMFAQQKISAKNMVIADEQQAMQQKMMMYFFPIFIGFIFYKFASGLSLYFTVFYLLSTFTQWKMSKVK